MGQWKRGVPSELEKLHILSGASAQAENTPASLPVPGSDESARCEGCAISVRGVSKRFGQVEALLGGRASSLTRRADEDVAFRPKDIAVLYRTNAQSRAVV